MNLFVLWTESYGEALNAANQLALEGGQILDCSIIGKWSQVLVHFQTIPQDSIFSTLSLTARYKKTWLPNIKDQIVDSYLSLSTTPVQDFILTIETSFIGDIFDFLQVVNLERFRIVDLRLLRFNEPKSLLLLTGAEVDADQILVVIENLKAQGKINFQFELVKSLHNQVKKLFSY